MIYGIGVDMIEVERIKKAIEKFGNRFLERIYTKGEIESCSKKKNKYLSFTSRFAAKEAFLKALGTGLSRGIRWKDIEIQDSEHTRPKINLHGKAKELSKERPVHLSISHIKEFAVAVAIIE